MTHLNRTQAFLAVVLASAGVAVASASAATPPQHSKRSVGPLVFDLPAGVACDFAVHEEVSYTQNITRWFDDAGNLVRVEDQIDLWVLHRNAETGKTLTERDHYAAHVDLVTGAVKQTGQSWHLRDSDNRLVLSGAGLVSANLFTGEVYQETPHQDPDGCAALS